MIIKVPVTQRHGDGHLMFLLHPGGYSFYAQITESCEQEICSRQAGHKQRQYPVYDAERYDTAADHHDREHVRQEIRSDRAALFDDLYLIFPVEDHVL